MSHESSGAVPVIDLRADDVVARITDAYQSVGFAQIVGHGIDPQLVDAMFEQSRRFHNLPLDAKRVIALDRNHRGWIAMASSTDRASELGAATRPNQSESFMVMREAGPADPDVRAGVHLAGPNQWPELAGFRQVIERYQQAMEQLARRVIAMFADALAAPPSLVDSFDRPTTWLRLLHYPSGGSDPADRGAFGSAPHVDFGAITLLAQDDVGGLQVAGPDNTWIDVEPIPGAFVMNTGQMMHRWSNGTLRATSHRVRASGGPARWSVPYFFDPHMETVVAPLPSCVTPGRPAGFEPVRFSDYVRHQLESTYDRHAGDR